MQALRNDVAPLANNLPGVRMACVLMLALSLSACVTLPGVPNANASGSPGDSVQTAISSGVTALGDFFSPEVREFKKLITEAKMDEALAFATNKESYFLERYYKPNTVAPAEFVSLAEHVSATEWAPKLLAARVALNTSLAFDSADARAQASAVWKASDFAQAAVEKALLYKITPVGRADVDSLVQARESLKARAIAAKPDVAAGMLEAVLTDAAPRYNYVGPLMLERSDFVASPGFQAAALARLNGAPDRGELMLLARRLDGVLTSENQAEADQRFVELVRQEFLADGRISLEELGALQQMSTPITRSKEPLKGMVKVGLASLVRKTGTREFHVDTQKDLAFDLENAADALLKQRDGSAFDFVYLVSVAEAKAQRETGSPRMEASRYRDGVTREFNPAYEPARRRLSAAESASRRANNQANSFSCAGLTPSSCRIAAAAASMSLGFAASEEHDAQTALKNTPQMLEKPRFSDYQYRLIPHTVKKEVSAVAVLWDVKGKQAWVSPVEHKSQQSFEVVQGVHDRDENRSSLLSRGNRIEEVNNYARTGVELSLNSLFSTGRLSSARKESAMDANAVLRLLDEEYTRNAPQDDPPMVGRVFKLPG